MSVEWTVDNPGAGSTGSLGTLARLLGSVAAQLESGQEKVDKALDVFPDSWTGIAAGLAESQIAGIKTRVSKRIRAVEGVKGALNVYSDEVEEIKARAAIQISLRDSAQESKNESLIELSSLPVTTDHIKDLQKRQGLESSLQEYSDAIAAAQEQLNELAKRRQAADDAVLLSVRSVIAENWEIETDVYPSDRSWEQQGSYDYDMGHPLGFTPDEYSAQELMDIFKKYPSEIFPFTVEPQGGDGTFYDGAVFELSGTLGLGWGIETGKVVVTTTDTSVKFTVISDGYFDGPGSTIEFSVVEHAGQYWLRKTADAVEAQTVVAPVASEGAGYTWFVQSQKFLAVVEKYGK